jgi:hypothetical protein
VSSTLTAVFTADITAVTGCARSWRGAGDMGAASIVPP